MDIRFISWWKKVVGLLGVIVLGAIGSGVWDIIGRPSLGSLQRVILTIASLGVKALKDTTYLEIAKGFTEATSTRLLYAYTSGIFLLLW